METNCITCKRQAANLAILKILHEYIDKYPDSRFGQVLAATKAINQNDSYNPDDLTWVDEFNLESVDLLNCMVRN